MTVRAEGDAGQINEDRYEFEVDDALSPKTYRRTPLDGPDKGKTSAGIYSISGDTLMMCYLDSGGLPTDFTITQGVDVKNKHLYVYKRQK